MPSSSRIRWWAAAGWLTLVGQPAPAQAPAPQRSPQDAAVETREGLRRLQQEVRDAAKSGDEARLNAALARFDQVVQRMAPPAAPPAVFNGGSPLRRVPRNAPVAPMRNFEQPNGPAVAGVAPRFLPSQESNARLMESMERSFAAMDDLFKGFPAGDTGRDELRRMIDEMRLPFTDPRFGLAPRDAGRPAAPLPPVLDLPPLARLGLVVEPAPAGATPGGVVVREVIANSPAAKAGLFKDDLIVRFAGKAAPGTAKGFEEAVGAFRVGGPVEVEVVRAGKNQTITLDLPEPPIRADQNVQAVRKVTPPAATERRPLGADIVTRFDTFTMTRTPARAEIVAARGGDRYELQATREGDKVVPSRIVVNGKEFAALADVPEPQRAVLADLLSGVPIR